MIECFREWLRSRRRAHLDQQKQETLHTLLESIIPSGVPYQYDVVPSFLQENPSDLRHPIRLTLLLPDVPLAIDLLGQESAETYPEARRYCSFDMWRRNRSGLAFKTLRLREYFCPYLILRLDQDPLDLYSIRENIRRITGNEIRS